MPSVAGSSTSKAGIATTASGERHIPQSLRADGTLRKEIRVRPGYRPPEDVEVYKNKTADAFKSRGKGGVPGAEYLDPKSRASPASNTTKPKTSSKTQTVTAKAETAVPSEPEKKEPLDPEAEKEKEAKKLTKRLRQARELQQKKEEGGALLPEQFEKVIRINELIRQLDKLGFDAEGNKAP